MKENIKKIIRSIMPFWIENLYIGNRYDVKKISTLGKAILMLVPAAFIYIVSNYKPSDKRNIKYWLPYGLMCDFQLRIHGKRIENKKYSVFSRLIRWILPYGYVLWWDNGARQPVSKPASSANRLSPPAATNTNNNAPILAALKAENEKNRVLQIELAERLEVSLLKLAVELKNQDP